MPCSGSCCTNENSRTFDPFIDHLALTIRCPLDNGKKAFRQPLVVPKSQSEIQSLLVELYHACLQCLDIASLTTLRRVSQYTRNAIDSLHQYKELYDHAPQSLRACLSMGVSSHIPLRRLYHALTSMECYYCKISDPPRSNLGGYLSLYACRRCCLFCTRNNPELKPVELVTLISLCCQRNGSIRNINNLPILRTITGSYTTELSGPLHTTPVFHRTSLVRGSSVSSTPGRSLTEKEHHTLFGNARTATIYHYPFLAKDEESDLRPTTNYVPPDTAKQVAHRYMSAISFPYLTTSRKTVEYGVFCGECVLHMRFEEHIWREEQTIRRMNFQDPSPTFRTRDRINNLRRKASKQYTESEDALNDARRRDRWNEKVLMEEVNEDSQEGRLSIQEHRLMHERQQLSSAEIEWRRTAPRPPLPRLPLQRFG